MLARIYTKKCNYVYFNQNTMEEHQENTKITPRDPPKLNFYYPKYGCKFATRIQEKI
jgi:hypothetical protein